MYCTHYAENIQCKEAKPLVYEPYKKILFREALLLEITTGKTAAPSPQTYGQIAGQKNP